VSSTKTTNVAQARPSEMPPDARVKPSVDTADTKRGSWDRIRLAQVDQGRVTGSATANSESQGSNKNSEKSAQLEEIIVTAQKRAERLQDVPISIAVVNGASLEQPDVQGVADALSRVPGMSVNQAGLGGATQLTMRGVSMGAAQCSGASTVGYYISSFDVKARTTESVTDGSGELNYREDAAVNVPLVPDVLAARAVVSYTKLNGWIDTPGASDINDTEQRSFRLKLAARLNDDLTVMFSGRLWRDSHGSRDYAPSNNYLNYDAREPLPEVNTEV
jgi:hypothetical protein